MCKRMLISLFTLLLALPAWAQLTVGDKAPAFKIAAALDGKVQHLALRQMLKKGPLVVYFFPSAYTQGCDLQAHDFSQKSVEFAAAGAQILGVSLDNIERLKRFSKDPEFCAGKIHVGADKGGKIARQFGLKVGDAVAGAKDVRGDEINHGFAERTTFVITPDGKIAAVIGGMSPGDNVKASLAAVQKLATH